MPRFEIWMEGFAATGESAGASSHGEVEAPTFREACVARFKGDNLFEEKSLTYWGCRLFDNEADARQGFG
jgi:hypothetical protein